MDPSARVQGEVYQAKDSKLGRDVAIKVLPEELAEDSERLARFEREAMVLASLNHPNIASIYGLEHSDGIHYLVLEFVEGETLDGRISRGPIAVTESLAIALEIAKGLEEAHERGVVHRDLKPANVKLTPNDGVKVLDFGLAKTFAEETPYSDGSQSPTLTRDATRVGVILGTASYMSPEQAKGKAVDKRTDVFALGAVLYEDAHRTKGLPWRRRLRSACGGHQVGARPSHASEERFSSGARASRARSRKGPEEEMARPRWDGRCHRPQLLPLAPESFLRLS